MQLVRTWTPTDYSNPAKSKMIEAGFIKVDKLYDKGQNYFIAYFEDGTTIDSRDGNGLTTFYKKCYNE